MWYWGRNEIGEGFGIALPADRSSPTQLGTEPEWNKLYGSGGSNPGAGHCAAAKTPGSLWMWGQNKDGELGQNSKTGGYNGISSPVQVPGTSWATVSFAYRQTLATKTDNTLWRWGADRNGNTGNNQNGTDYSSPIQIPGDWATGYKSISQGYNCTAAIKSNGQLWAWGLASVCGQDDAVTRSSPIQIPGGGWSQISLGSNSALALKTDGTLWAWGSEAYGSLGQNNRSGYSSPKQIPGTDWHFSVRGNYISAAIKTDGTLWTWGDNRYGQLGTNTGGPGTPRSSPVQIPGTTWSKIVPIGGTGLGVDSGFCAIKTDNTLWAWGRNPYGNLAYPSSSDSRSSPTQIPGTNWVADAFSGRRYGVTALRSQS